MLDLEKYNYLIGMTVKGANYIGEGVFVVRATVVDGKAMVVTADYRTDRINVAVRDGKITNLLKVG